MIALIFEVTPKDDQKGNYLDITATMLTMVEKVAGFISVKRFQNPSNPEKIFVYLFLRR